MNPNQQAPPMEQMPMDQPGQETQVPPEMQEQFDLFVINAINVVHDKTVSEGILTRILHNENRLEAIAEATVDITMRLADSAEGEGLQISNEVLVHGGNAVLGEIITMAEAAGMQKLTDEQKNEAFQRATAIFINSSVESGNMSKDQLVQMSEQAQQTPEGQQIVQTMQEQGGQGPAPSPEQPIPPEQPGGILAQGGAA